MVQRFGRGFRLWRGGDAKARMRVSSGERGGWWNMLRRGVMLFGRRASCFYEISCFCVATRFPLSMRFHAFLAVMKRLDEISCFLAAEFSF